MHLLFDANFQRKNPILNYEEKMANLKPDLRERVFLRGLSYPSEEELLMLILGSGTKEHPVEILAHKIRDAIDASNRETLIEELLKISGIGLGKALSIAAAVEFGRRKSQMFNIRIECSTDIIPYIEHYGFKTNEHFLVISLSGAHEIVSKKVVAVGNANSAIISPREIFFEAAKMHASAIIVAHNHPSGICAPSELDIETTHHICAAGEILGILVLDHVILGRGKYYSFLEHGLLNSNF